MKFIIKKYNLMDTIFTEFYRNWLKNVKNGQHSIVLIFHNTHNSLTVSKGDRCTELRQN
jgi:hypothetical protein